MSHAFAYLFERYPSFVQVFCYREVSGMQAQKMAPAIFSVREAEGGGFETHAGQRQGVVYLPRKEKLSREVRDLAERKRIPRTILPQIQQWGAAPDKQRLYEAAWIGYRLRRLGVRHVHAHFGGLAARTALWIKRFYGIAYSFTGHANDIFVPADLPVSAADLIGNAALVVTVSDYSATRLREAHPDSAARIHRVYNGIDPSAFRSGNPALAAPYIVSVGRLVEKKGFADLISACAVLREEGTTFECDIAGDGPLEPELRQRIGDAGLQDCVRLLGAMSQDDVRVLLARGRVFALACAEEKSGGMDNLPTVITEAMLAGLPVVSTRLAGVPEQVVDGRTGRLAAPGDAKTFARDLAAYLQDPALAAAHGVAGRLHAERTFDLARCVRRLKRLLCRYGRARPALRAIATDPRLALCRLGLWTGG